MINKKDTLTVDIFGTPYALDPSSASDGLDVEKLAEYVDTKMRDISERIAIVSSTKVAVLAALEIAQELFQENAGSQEEANDANERIAKLLKSIDDAT